MYTNISFNLDKNILQSIQMILETHYFTDLNGKNVKYIKEI